MILEKTGQSFSQALGNGFRQTVASIFSDTRMSSTTMTAGHRVATLARMSSSSSGYFVVAQDTTHYNYHGHKAMSGLGRSSQTTNGVIQHNAVVLDESGVHLGVIDQQYWSRGGSVGFEGVESQKWTRALDVVSTALGGCSRPVVLVQDREADVYDFFQHPRSANIELIVRVCTARSYEVLDSDGSRVRLPEIGSLLRRHADRQVAVERSGRAALMTVSLHAARVRVFSSRGASSQEFSLVLAQETGCVDVASGADIFRADDACLWHLLSSLAVETQDDVERIVHCYSLRWQVERFHYTMKSGALHVEKLQFDDLETMINALSFYSIIAWELLFLLGQLRDHGSEPVGLLFGERDVLLLRAFSKKPVLTVKDGVVALAKLVGFAPTKKQPLPGVKVLGQALERFYFVRIGANLDE